MMLPPNATVLERNIERTQMRLSPPRIIPTLWDSAKCPANLLPFLAWSVSAEQWDPIWTDDTKRAAINVSMELHRYKGTSRAIRHSLEVVGQGDADVIERSDYLRCDGTVMADGERTCGGEWATFRVVLKHPVTIPEATLIRQMLETNKRNCVHLQSIEFSAAAFRCDGSITCDGSFTCGTVDTTLN